MPRKPLGEHAMTAAERQRKRRARLQQPVAEPPELVAARAEIARLQAALDLERPRYARARAEIAGLQAEIKHIKDAVPKVPRPPKTPDERVDAANKRIKKLEAEIYQLRVTIRNAAMDARTFAKLSQALREDHLQTLSAAEQVKAREAALQALNNLRAVTKNRAWD